MDDFRYLYEQIKSGEGQQLDFKQHIASAAKIARTLVAFANSEGGKLLVGVDDQGLITGVDQAQERHVLLQAAKKCCDPPLYLHFRERLAQRKVVLEVVVDKSNKQHRALDEAGRWLPWVRVEDQTVLAPGAAHELEIEALSDPIPILMERHVGLLNYLEANDQISIKDYMQIMNISYGMASRSLDDLVDSGVLLREEVGGRAWYFLSSAG
ncbi:MAG: ATP-binding protein [Bacteroidetes bacterium]|nr:ATP-binding protein [Bacteroidota bacterium]